MTKKRVLEILSRSNGDDKVSMYCDRALSGLILLNLLAVSLESVDQLSAQYGNLFWGFELFSVTIFSCEYILRIWSSDAIIDKDGGTSARRRFGYIFSFTGLIDLIAILPSILPLFLGQVDLRWLRVLRLARLLKISHYSTALEDLVSAIREERNAFGAALYLFCIALFVSSALMYVVEHEVQPENFSSIPTTMWWSMITLTTVGYGDVSPMTSLGKLVGAVTAVMGICVVALLTGIVATAFANQVARRKDIFEAEVAHALSDGVISQDELKHIKQMQSELGLSDEHARALIDLLSERKASKSD